VIRVRWAEVAQAAGYGVERSPNGDTAWVTVATLGDDVTAYTDAGLTPGMTYFYRVHAMLQGGASSSSDVVSATTLVSAPGPTVVSLTSRSRSTIELGWADVAGETGYRIERSADGETGWVTIGTTGQDITEYTDTGLDPSTTYFYRVIAINDGGASAPSNVVSDTTKPGAGGEGDGSDEGSEGGEPSPGSETPAIVL
jgi:titin